MFSKKVETHSEFCEPNQTKHFKVRSKPEQNKNFLKSNT